MTSGRKSFFGRTVSEGESMMAEKAWQHLPEQEAERELLLQTGNRASKLENVVIFCL